MALPFPHIFKPIHEDYVLDGEDAALGYPPYTPPMDWLDTHIEKLRDAYNNYVPTHGDNVKIRHELNMKRYALIRHLNWRQALVHGYARPAEPPSQELTSAAGIYNQSSPDFSTLIENPYIWMRNNLSSSPSSSPSSNYKPRLARAKHNAEALRATITNPPIFDWIATLNAQYGHLLASQTQPAALTGVYYFQNLQERLDHNLPLNVHPHGHKATILLDLDWYTGRSTPYFVVAPRLALSYLWYKTPLDIRHLPSDPLWDALQARLPGHVEVWPLPCPGPITFGEIGTYKEKAAFNAIEQAVLDVLPTLRQQSIPFEMPELENRFVIRHAPNWDYLIPKATFEHENLHYLDTALTWNSDRVRLTRDRIGARGPLEGTRLQLRAFGSRGEATGEPRELTLPTSEMYPTTLYDPQTTDLRSLAEAIPTVVHAAARYPDRVKLNEVWVL